VKRARGRTCGALTFCIAGILPAPSWIQAVSMRKAQFRTAGISKTLSGAEGLPAPSCVRTGGSPSLFRAGRRYGAEEGDAGKMPAVQNGSGAE